MTKRYVDLPEGAEAGLRGFVEELDDRLSGSEDNYEVVEDVLVDLNGDRDIYEAWQNDQTIANAERVRLQSYDPRNATLESEYYADKDEAAFAESKPLQWLWRQFDNSPVADNVDFGLRVRRTIADHLFEDCGENCRFFKGITMTYGHNISVGDNVVVHDEVHLDDRGRLTVGDRASISDGVHVYTHSHDVVDQTSVTNYHTIIEDDVRLTFDSVVHAGARVGENAMVGARAVVRDDVPAHHVAVGTPAKSVRIKPGWDSTADPLEDANQNRQEQRRLPDGIDLDEDEVFDEFGRDLSPPGDR